MKCGMCWETFGRHEEHICPEALLICEGCGKRYERKNIDEHYEKCSQRIVSGVIPDADHYVYIFTFLVGAHQRYYVGETAGILDRLDSHYRSESKIIHKDGERKRVESENIYPVSFNIVDTASSKREVKIKEKMAFVDLVREVECADMVCGGQ